MDSARFLSATNSSNRNRGSGASLYVQGGMPDATGAVQRDQARCVNCQTSTMISFTFCSPLKHSFDGTCLDRGVYPVSVKTVAHVSHFWPNRAQKHLSRPASDRWGRLSNQRPSGHRWLRTVFWFV